VLVGYPCSVHPGVGIPSKNGASKHGLVALLQAVELIRRGPAANVQEGLVPHHARALHVVDALHRAPGANDIR